MKKRLFSCAAVILTFLAMFMTSTASIWVFYQPKVPKSLRKI